MFPLDILELYVLNSFRWKASRLFNSLPANIRNTTNCETSVVKKKVDSYLQPILWLRRSTKLKALSIK